MLQISFLESLSSNQMGQFKLVIKGGVGLNAVSDNNFAE